MKFVFLLLLIFTATGHGTEFSRLTSKDSKFRSSELSFKKDNGFELTNLEIEEILEDEIIDLISEHFPLLQTYKIVFKSFNSKNDYFRSDIKKSTIIQHAKYRTYRIQYNPRLFKEDVDPRALRGILLHELKHINDYTKMSGVELIQLAISAIFDELEEFEIGTDEFVVEQGLGKCLLFFRAHQKKFLSEEAYTKKLTSYLNPHEIIELSLLNTKLDPKCEESL